MIGAVTMTVTIDARTLAGTALGNPLILQYKDQMDFHALHQPNSGALLELYWICSEVDKCETDIRDKLELRPLKKIGH